MDHEDPESPGESSARVREVRNQREVMVFWAFLQGILPEGGKPRAVSEPYRQSRTKKRFND